MSEPIGTYPAPAHGWTCFHCGETFSIAKLGSLDKAIAAATEHFGTTPDEDALCRLATRDQRELAERLRFYQSAMHAAIEARERAQEDAWLANTRLTTMPRLFPGALSLHDVWNQVDSLEGRAEAAEAVVTEICKTHPELVAKARDFICRPVEDTATCSCCETAPLCRMRGHCWRVREDYLAASRISPA